MFLRELIIKLGLSALMVTHDQNEAMAISDRILLLNNGVIEQQGTPQEMYGSPATLFAAEFMGSNNRLHGKVMALENGRARIEGASWSLWGRAGEGVSVGEPATAVIRVERLRLDGAAQDNQPPATAADQHVPRRPLGVPVPYRRRRLSAARLRNGAARCRTLPSDAPGGGCVDFSAAVAARYPPDGTRLQYCARLAQSRTRRSNWRGSLAVARRAVVLSSGGQRRLPEGIDLLAAVGAKGNVQRRRFFRTLIEA